MQVLDSVLLVDDDEAATFYHKGLIKKLGLAKEIVAVNDGKSAIDYIETNYYELKQLPSLMLLDIAMPGMSGIELLKELQSSDLLSVKKIPVAVVTNCNSDKEQSAVEQLGRRIIPKPLDEEKMIEILYSEVLPTIHAPEKKQYINELHRVLVMQREYLKEQHKHLEERREEIKKFIQEIREKYGKYKR